MAVHLAWSDAELNFLAFQLLCFSTRLRDLSRIAIFIEVRKLLENIF